MSSHSAVRSWGAGAVCAALLAAYVPASRHAAAAPPLVSPLIEQQLDAARLMARSLDCIKRLRVATGPAIDRSLDPNETGIIGDEFTPLTTSLGEVEAKRTSANPAFAALLVKYFHEAGLKPGDVVAVGASGSFPALLLATLSASRTLDLEPIVIYSFGASMYGANLPGFTFADMLAGLRTEGIMPYRFEAVSAGGDEDRGAGVLFDEEGTTLVAEAARSRVRTVGGSSLAERISGRLRILRVGGARAADPLLREHRRGIGQLRRRARVAGTAERSRDEHAACAGGTGARPDLRISVAADTRCAPAERPGARTRQRSAVRPGSAAADWRWRRLCSPLSCHAGRLAPAIGRT